MQTIPDTRKQLLSVFDHLSADDQQCVLAFAQNLANEPEGIPVDEFVQFFRDHPVTPDEAEKMRRIMDEVDS